MLFRLVKKKNQIIPTVGEYFKYIDIETIFKITKIEIENNRMLYAWYDYHDKKVIYTAGGMKLSIFIEGIIEEIYKMVEERFVDNTELKNIKYDDI
jgi:hypothetical protein